MSFLSNLRNMPRPGRPWQRPLLAGQLQRFGGTLVIPRRFRLALALMAIALAVTGCGIPHGPIDPNTPPNGPWEALVVFPLTNLLIFLSKVIGGLGIPYSYGFAIVLLTLIIKVVTLPLTLAQLRSIKATQELQPKLQELQKKYGKDRERLAQAQMALYKEAGVNPLGGCLPLLIQMPILFGLYAALYRLAGLQLLTNQRFFIIPDLSFPTPEQGIGWIVRYISEGQYVTVIAYLILPVLFLISQIVMQKMSQITPPSDNPQQAFTNQMMMMMSILFTYFTLTLPSGLSLYWVTSNVLQIIQQYFVTGWGGLKLRTASAEKGTPAAVAVATAPPSEEAPVHPPEKVKRSRRSQRRRK
ncbi:MAG: YidC/Oxa1 family membrane protein insertase [Anaerolineae bacterium]|nr:YidC/Oxa1 family membrane protein insertase [Anaerolineae bacterium]MDW8098996.1 YidC/Oxa1 family membrane protein insertase [Anaerolineae bacterium]